VLAIATKGLRPAHPFMRRQIIECLAAPPAAVERLDARTFDDHLRHIFTH
jgi:hypothetical protein